MASDKPVAVEIKNGVFPSELTLTRKGSEEPMQHQYYGYCGNLMLPFVPVILVGRAVAFVVSPLDVADVGSRYFVVRAGEERTITIDIAVNATGDHKGWFSVRTEVHPTAPLPRKHHLDPGDYVVELRFNEGRRRYLFPPPLGWMIYGHPLEAACTFEVSDSKAN